MARNVVLVSIELESDDPTTLARETRWAKENAGRVIEAFTSKAQVGIYSEDGVLERSNQVNGFPDLPPKELP